MPSLSMRLRLFQKAAVGLFSDKATRQAAEMLVGIIPGGRGDPPARSTQELLLGYDSMPWLRACVHKIGLSVSGPFKLYRATGRKGATRHAAEMQCLSFDARKRAMATLRQGQELTPVLTHPFLDLWDRPNGFLTGLSTQRLIQNSLDLVGETFLLKGRNGLGKPSQLWPIPAHWVLATPTPTNAFYRMSWRGWQEEIPDTEVLWIKSDPPPWNPYGRGSGTAGALLDELETDEYVSKFMKTFFFHGARPDLIISGDNLSEADTARMEQAWNQKHQGWWRAFRAHFFSRKIDVQQLTHNFEHLQMIPLRTHERDIIMQTFGVPPEFLGVGEQSNLAKSLTAETFIAKWVIIPRKEIQRASLQEHLLPEWDDRLILDYDSPIPQDVETQLRAAQIAPYALTVDEWRALQGLEPTEDDTGDIVWVPQGLTPYRNGLPVEEAIYQPPTPAVAPGSTPTGETAPTKEPKAAMLHQVRVLDDEEAVALTLAALALSLAAPLHDLFLRAVDDLRASIDVSRLEQALASGHASLAREAIPWEMFAATLGGLVVLLAQRLDAGAQWAARQLTQELSLVEPFIIDTYTSLRAQQRLRQASGATIYGLVERSQAAVDAILEEGLQAGWSALSIAHAMRTVVGLTLPQAQQVERQRQQLMDLGIDDALVADDVTTLTQTLLQRRATTMAEHESYSAVLMGQQEAWDAALVAGLLNAQTDRKRWETEADATVCAAICVPMAGETTTVQGYFTLPDGSKVQQPPGHVQCRCTAILVRGA